MWPMSSSASDSQCKTSKKTTIWALLKLRFFKCTVSNILATGNLIGKTTKAYFSWVTNCSVPQREPEGNLKNRLKKNLPQLQDSHKTLQTR